MLTLEDGMLLYHGSYTAVSRIDLARCNKGLDFGQGFYVTTSYEQARAFVPNSIRRNTRSGNIAPDFPLEKGQISVYRFHANPRLNIRIFQGADLDWLHFVAANRNRDLFQELHASMDTLDIVGGNIADDNTSRVLNGYVTGLFGQPGSELADSFAIQSLLPNRLKNQFCFRTEAAIGALEFLRSDAYAE